MHLPDGTHQVWKKLLLKPWLSLALKKQPVLVLKLLGLYEPLLRLASRTSQANQHRCLPFLTQEIQIQRVVPIGL